MKGPISGETLFEDFVKKIERNQEAVALKNPHTPAQIVSTAYARIEKCGLYQDDCQEWYQKPSLEKTWSNFKAPFTRPCKETRISSRKSNTKGYASNVQAAQTNVEVFTEM